LRLEYFVCDWYTNVNCENSESFYNLNDQIGNTMGGSSKKEMMNSARDIIMFPQQTANGKNKGGDMFSNYPSQLGSPLGINGGGPARGNLNLAQPTAGGGGNAKYPAGGPQRGANGGGGTVYVNSLGQLSTDKDSGFDPKHSFILKPDVDSNFDLDVRVPSNAFDTLKGIGNSYSFGFPGDGAPTRGSEDLSEPVDPAAFLANQQYLPPYAGGPNRQIYTYPQDAQSLGPNNIPAILPEYTGQLNQKLSAQSPKYPTAQVYGPPPPAQPAAQTRYQQPQSGNQARPQPASQNRNQQQGNQQRQQQQPQRSYQQPQQALPAQTRYPSAANSNQQANHHQQSQPVRLYQQPQSQQRQQPSFSQQPQPFRPQSQQIERRQFNVPQAGGNHNHNRNGGGGGGGGGHHHQQQQQNGNRGGGGGGNGNGGNRQSNDDYLRNFLRDKIHIHHDKVGLVELIQRLFHPASTQQRVVSADVIPSPARESYSFTYDGQGASSPHQHQHQHKHTGSCGHQGY
jgi:hypothetical protein